MVWGTGPDAKVIRMDAVFPMRRAAMMSASGLRCRKSFRICSGVSFQYAREITPFTAAGGGAMYAATGYFFPSIVISCIFTKARAVASATVATVNVLFVG